MNILVTGGAGFIGSHTCVSLLETGHSVIIADNFSNSNIEIIEKIKKITGKEVILYNVDLTDREKTSDIFVENNIDGVIHFAGLKSVGESIQKPLEYYRNNLESTLNLLEMCQKHKVNKFIFSSSATVYGNNQVPFEETMGLLPTTNPYGETKSMIERILIDFAKSVPEFSVSILRYFNPVGAHKSGLIGESPSGIPNNLMPYITQVAKGKLNQLRVFGNDYNTVDGTGVRDYIHVVDLAEGHLAALDNLKKGVSIYNLGTGKGTSVLQLIKAFEDANKIKIPFEIVERRDGDIAECFASTNKANEELNWVAKKDIFEMCLDSWNFEKNKILL